MSDPFKIIEPTVISFSGGRTSAYMLWRVLQSNNGLPNDAIVCFANTGKEEEATLKFVKDCEVNWNVPIHWLEYKSHNKFKKVDFNLASRNGEPFEELIQDRKMLPNVRSRFCTGTLKIRTIHRYVRSLGWDHHETDNSDFIGIRADEKRRAIKQPKEKVPLYVSGVVKKDIFDFWSKQNFDLELPIIDGETIGGNCDLCFLKSLPKILTLVKQKPERAVWWAKQESWAEKQTTGDGNRFRIDRPRYADIHNFIDKQGDMFDDSIECFCGD